MLLPCSVSEMRLPCTADELVRNVAKLSQEDCDKDHGNEDTKFAIQALEQECMRVHERLEQHSKSVITRLIVKSMQNCSMYRPIITGMTSWKLVQNDKFSACLQSRETDPRNRISLHSFAGSD